MAKPPIDESTLPWVRVLFREVLWRASIGHSSRLSDIEAAVNLARTAIGLKGYASTGGAASQAGQELTWGYKNCKKGKKDVLFRKDVDGHVGPYREEWLDDWRRLYAPRHLTIRTLGQSGQLLQKAEPKGVFRRMMTDYRFIPHDPVYPEVDFVWGDAVEFPKRLDALLKARLAALGGDEHFADHGHPKVRRRLSQAIRGVYFKAQGGNELYIGKTDEPDTRERLHHDGGYDWFLFVVPAWEEELPNKDVIDTAEALLIAAWREVANVQNKNGGTDTPPATGALRDAVALATVASGLLVRLHRDGKYGIKVPFHKDVADGYPLPPTP